MCPYNLTREASPPVTGTRSYGARRAWARGSYDEHKAEKGVGEKIMGLFFNNHHDEPNTAHGHRCPNCGSTDVERCDEGLAPLPASPMTMFNGTHVAPVSEFRCRRCGHSWEDIF